VTALFAVLVAVPLVLPIFTRFAAIAFVLPLLAMGVAFPRCVAAARRSESPLLWRTYALAALLGAVTAALGALSAFASGFARPAFYLGLCVSVCFVVGLVPVVWRRVREAQMERIVDALLFDAVVVALGVWFVVAPGLARGETVLALVFLIDLAAIALAAIGTLAASSTGGRRTGWWIVGVCAGAAVGDALVALGSAPPALVALCWSASSIALVVAATDRSADSKPIEEDERMSFVAARTILPLVAVLVFPAVAGVLSANDNLPADAAAYFAAFFLATLVLAFGRQAYLLLDNRRSVISERRLRREVVRRNEELEALTTLATTMTETLEEDPVVERGLDAMRLAARASSMAMHVRTDAGLELRAAAGEWATDAPWATREAASGWKPGVSSHGARQIVRLAVAARGSDIGMVTLVRREDDPVAADELRLLRLLVDQVAIAVQNARDYRDRLEQAIRDPLTGLYNRRFFYEAFDKELHRSRRSGRPASLVLIDVDSFKQVNDTLGHTAGDGVLCRIGEIATSVIRPTDSFARVGGEEFALLLPETSQLDALVVAERVRRAVAGAEILEDRTVTVSAGIASCPDDATALEELEAKADAALYWAKDNGKNLCAVATEVVVSDRSSERDAMVANLHALVSAVDSKHLNTRDHSESVAAYTLAIGQRLGLSAERMVPLRRAALFHDIGKLAVRGVVLGKPTALNPDEIKEVRVHPAVGASILVHSGFAMEAAWVRQHHERIDGEGYPDGLRDGDIALEARIIAVADAFEAMTSDRPYRRAMPVAEAVAELRQFAGTQFDARVVEVLLELLEQGALPVLEQREGSYSRASS
jgi:diguanylate cyclase (GGDEF)-like protein/putative nucleotidyltransferase with HDIG domain